MMSILPKSGFEVLHPSPDQLAVVAHPMYWLLLLTVLSAVIGIYVGILGLKKGGNSNLVLQGYGYLRSCRSPVSVVALNLSSQRSS